MASNKRRLKSRIDDLQNKVSAQKTYFCSEVLQNLKNLKTQFFVANKAAVKATEMLQKEPLPGVGEHEWELLYKAAEQYSIKYAYPEHEFPVTDENSKCPLCMQSLSEPAKDRLSRFRNYILDESKIKADSARELLENEVERLKNGPPLEIDQVTIAEIIEIRPIIKRKMDVLIEDIKITRDWIHCIQIHAESTKPDDRPEVDFSIIEDMKQLSFDVDKAIRLLESKDNIDVFQRRQKRKVELEAKNKFATNIAVINNYIDNISSANKLRSIVTRSLKRLITQKEKDLSNAIISEDLQNALNIELLSLGMHKYQFQFQERGKTGSTVRRLMLCNTSTDAKMSDILSEGEQKVLSIAAFLAELGLTTSNTGIIFDDPVTSLDFSYIDAVAKRLAKESKSRQVVIFTHNIGFYFRLMSHAAAFECPILGQSIVCRSRKPGYCDNDDPWDTKPVKKRISNLKDCIETTKSAYDEDPDSEKYRETLEVFYSKLRSTWEMVVEREILFEVVRRFESDVATTKLHSVVVDTEIYCEVYQSMSECSEEILAHNHAPGQPPSRKTPADLVLAIQRLEKFLSSLKVKREVVRRDRRSIESPPKVHELN